MNPYTSLPSTSFWSRSVARLEPDMVDPVVNVPFTISTMDRVATAGSCFAQHIAKTLVRNGYNYYVPEVGPEERNYGVFPARFGNIYTTRQLLQLFQRAYGLFEPNDQLWRSKDGGFVDPFRPQVEPNGFLDPRAVEADRELSLAATRDMFENATVFIFTLGLTEGWRAKSDGAVVPLAPGVAGGDDKLDDYEFFNTSTSEMVEDLHKFIKLFKNVNPNIKIILTVSPVPLIATFEDQHVLTSTIYSKSALRVVAEEIKNSDKIVAYFPSYEIITGHNNGYRYFAPDLRGVLPEGVDHVMSIFTRHFLNGKKAHSSQPEPCLNGVNSLNAADIREIQQLYDVICDEEAIEENR